MPTQAVQLLFALRKMPPPLRLREPLLVPATDDKKASPVRKGTTTLSCMLTTLYGTHFTYTLEPTNKSVETELVKRTPRSLPFDPHISSLRPSCPPTNL